MPRKPPRRHDRRKREMQHERRRPRSRHRRPSPATRRTGMANWTSAEPLLVIRGVQTFYGKIQALKGVDVDVNQGEIVTMIGANGAGKSTLMMTVCGNPRAREGQILYRGEDITNLPTHDIMSKSIAQSPEGRRVFGRMTVMENLQMGAIAGGREDVRRRSAQGLRAVPAPEGASRPARRHALGRRAADAGDRPRADEPAEAAASRRAVARPGAA